MTEMSAMDTTPGTSDAGCDEFLAMPNGADEAVDEEGGRHGAMAFPDSKATMGTAETKSTMEASDAGSAGSSETSDSAAAANARPSKVSSTVAATTRFCDGELIDILSQSLALTDLIFGLYALELWRYDETTGKLLNVDLHGGTRDEETGRGGGGGGMLLKRRTQEGNPENDYPNHSEAAREIDRLTDPSRRDFLPPTPVDPGVGLPGVLWAEQGAGVRHHHLGGTAGGDSVLWRDVRRLAEDPDQPYDERLQSFAKAGFTLAAGIPFDINGYRGIVIYFGNPHGNQEKLRHPANSRFMNSAAQMIGCAAAIQGPTEEIKAFRDHVRYQNWHRMKIKLLTTLRFGGTLRKAKKEQQTDMGTTAAGSTMFRRSSVFDLSLGSIRESTYRVGLNAKELYHGAKARFSRWSVKIGGGSAGVPPRFSLKQCMWTFVGVLVTHTLLSRMNLLIATESDGDLSLVLAPLGALTTLQYNLTAAPAAQPRNAIFSQVFANAVAIALGYVPHLPPWFRSALAPAIVIPGMARLGIIHPPAAAAAIVFSSGKVGWVHFGIFLSGVALSIVTAVGINNMSDERQYPTSWYLLNKAKINPLKKG